MTATIKELPKSQVELTITITPAEQQPYIARAAKKISEEIKIPGFRPGLAPLDVVTAQVGEMKILEGALETIVRETFVAAVKQHELKTIGMPDIAIEKMAPKNDLVFRATVSVVPPVTLPDFSKISIKVKPVSIADSEVDTVIADVQKMHAILADSDSAAGAHDQVTVDMDLFDGAVPLDGGQARGHIVPLDEPYYIPGFAEKLVGVKAGDELNFELPFPADHYQKMYAGKNITFKVKVLKVQTRVLPAIDEEFAKKFGTQSVEELRKNISENLAEEQTRKAEEAADVEMLQAVIAKTNFGDLPESIVDAERRRMMQDLMRSLKQHGITVEQYLGDMKKSPEELEAGFTDQAIERAKMGLVTHAVAVAEKIDATKEELETELNAIRESYKNNADAIARLLEPDTQEAVLNSLRNRKVMEWMREKMVK
jgi:trigger factor